MPSLFTWIRHRLANKLFRALRDTGHNPDLLTRYSIDFAVESTRSYLEDVKYFPTFRAAKHEERQGPDLHQVGQGRPPSPDRREGWVPLRGQLGRLYTEGGWGASTIPIYGGHWNRPGCCFFGSFDDQGRASVGHILFTANWDPNSRTRYSSIRTETPPLRESAVLEWRYLKNKNKTGNHEKQCAVQPRESSPWPRDS